LPRGASLISVRQFSQQGADFVKVYSNLTRESYRAILDEAEKQNLPVVGHVPGAITLARRLADAYSPSKAEARRLFDRAGLDAFSRQRAQTQVGEGTVDHLRLEVASV
jgi:hypothetical protein